MYRTHTNGELRLQDAGLRVTLCGWVHRSREMGGMVFIDLRDRYGITQLYFDQQTNPELCANAAKLGREYVVQVSGTVRERSSKNTQIPTGEIEIVADSLEVLNSSEIPPFTIKDDTDGGEEIRMKHRYLDLRRDAVRSKLELRHKMAREVRNFLDSQQFIEVETPVLIRSTPEGARDFIVPSRLSQGQFYALPQSPQLFKQLLMVAGFDRYYQIVKCFRDEDFRSDRQPEFTQIDCEMSFVHQDDILNLFEGLIKHLFIQIKNISFETAFQRMPFSQAMERYGNDKPDLRFGMEITALTDIVKGRGFSVFDNAEYVGGICATGCAVYTRKQIDELTDWVKRPQIGAAGLIYVRVNEDGSLKSSVDKFFDETALRSWAEQFGAQPGDLLLILAGKRQRTLFGLSELRLHMGDLMGLRDPNVFAPLWVVDFPLVEWDEENSRFHAMHHPFTSPKPEDIPLLDSNPAAIRANAYDLVINGVEIGGGSIRIFDEGLQQRMFSLLGFSPEDAQAQFGFLLSAFRYGAPPHGGIAFGFDRLTALFSGCDSIRDVIAFPKNNAGRDLMIDAPSVVSVAQLKELGLDIKL